MDYIKHDIAGKDLRLVFVKTELVFNSTSFILEFIERMMHTTEAERLVLDMSNVQHIDSSAVGMFIILKKDTQKAGKKLSIVGLTENVVRILNFLDIMSFLDMEAA